MTIPDFQTLMRPVLTWLEDGQTRRSRDVKDAMADLFSLTGEERAHMLPSGRARTMGNRVGWALTYLSQAGLIDRPSRGRVTINPDGREALQKFPDRIGMKDLEAYPAYLEFKERKARMAGADLRFIQKAMGHGSITTTARIYAHLYDDELELSRGL